jgi:SAM-dependent methyltransferase
VTVEDSNLPKKSLVDGWTLNLGCGPDGWGEVRVDVDTRTQTGVESKLNVRADAHNLPFRDAAFSYCRCWHVLEHVESPARVLSELRRTCREASLRFPVDEGYYMQMIIGAIGFDWPLFINAYRTMKRRAHKWIIRWPKAKLSDRFIEYPRWIQALRFGRKARFLRRFSRPFRYYYEMEISI